MASMGSKWAQAGEIAQRVLELTKLKVDMSEDSGIEAIPPVPRGSPCSFIPA